MFGVYGSPLVQLHLLVFDTTYQPSVDPDSSLAGYPSLSARAAPRASLPALLRPLLRHHQLVLSVHPGRRRRSERGGAGP